MESGVKNYYQEFLHHSRWLTDGALRRRNDWLDSLTIEDKNSLLFRFEFLLKGAVCLGNLRNYPGLIPQDELAKRNFHFELTQFQIVLRELIELGERLNEKALPMGYTVDVFSDNVADELLRAEHLERTLQQETPEQSLSLLLGTMHMVQRMAAPFVKAEFVSQRQFVTLHTILYQEIMRSRYFNVLTLFEFRIQYDEIVRHQVLLTLSSIEHEAAQRITSVSLLAIFRLLNYLDMVSQWDDTQSVGVLFALLCLLHSDGNQFASFLANDTAHWLSSDFGDEYDSLTPPELTERYDELNLQFQELKSLRELLESTGNQLDLELKKTFLQQLPTFDALGDTFDGASPEMVQGLETVRAACNSLRSFLQNAAVLLVQEFNISVTGDDLFEDFTSDTTRSERLRRDIWMFRQILKAFVVKTKGTESVRDRWIGLNTFKFVKTFVAYFRSMGYQLLRYSDYDRFDKFMALVDRLRDGDVLEIQRLSTILDECEAFYVYLENMFDAVSQRKELADIPFNSKDAARTLKLFIA